LNTKQKFNFGEVTTLAQFLSQLEKAGLKIKIIENYIVLSPQGENKSPVNAANRDRVPQTRGIPQSRDTAAANYDISNLQQIEKDVVDHPFFL